MDSFSSRDVGYDATHERRVHQTLGELQLMVRDHEAALNKLRATAIQRPAATILPEAPLRIMKAAYDGLAIETPYLPGSDSLVPALIALRKTHQTVGETRAYLASREESADKIRRRLETEQSNLRDQQALSRSLQDRVESLRDGLESRMEMDPTDIARERVAELRRQKKGYDKETSRLLKALRSFIDDQLGSMLAAEELGGPVVGDIMDIDNDDLAAGFSSQGRLKTVKENPNQDKRQRRIDDIWGQRQETQPAGERNESAAAAAEMRDLTEELLNALMESDGDNSSAYIQLAKESAAARFLIRSKVAQFHPRDSTKVRLVDFGRDLDD
ncbi:hypothetical protein BX600DRAFT_185899 [Xylariales sp. PMI_506]|nr:hypothetical protein BX600DRAFT_185899 [Xylariales sp. PMI_506]